MSHHICDQIAEAHGAITPYDDDWVVKFRECPDWWGEEYNFKTDAERKECWEGWDARHPKLQPNTYIGRSNKDAEDAKRDCIYRWNCDQYSRRLRKMQEEEEANVKNGGECNQ
tara:strand:- start:159 stop:497 length:339 start_codon:yes stop_codon:yes gene_type:complete